MILNVQRDGLYIDPSDDLKLAWSATQTSYQALTSVKLAGTVPVDYAAVEVDDAAYTLNANQKTGIGVMIQQPLGDRTPYRVKAHVHTPGNQGQRYAILVGYAPASPITGDNTVAAQTILPFDQKFDDLIMVENEADGDTFDGRAMVFAIVMYNPTGSSLSNSVSYGALSVQNLGVKPPTMQNAVS